MAVSDALWCTLVSPGFLTSVLTEVLFQKPATTFLICIRGERQKIADQTGIEPATCRSRVCYTTCWATRPGSDWTEVRSSVQGKKLAKWGSEPAWPPCASPAGYLLSFWALRQGYMYDKRGLNSLPNNKDLDLPELKASADDILDVATMTKYVLHRVENSGKRRKCWLPAFSPFPTMFSKGFFHGVVKRWDCVAKI